MTEIINALWSLHTWLALTIGVAIGLMAASFLAMSRERDDDDDGPKTILIGPAEEPIGDMVDVRGVLGRYE